MRKSLIAIYILSIIFRAGYLAAEEEPGRGCAILEWNPPSAGPVTTWTAPLCAAGKIVAQPFFFYNRTRGIFNDEGHYKAYKNGDSKSQWQEILFMQFGITDRFEIDAQGIFQQNNRHEDGNSAHDAGFGDTYIFARYCALDEMKWLPQVTAIFQLKMPTGKYQKADPDKLGTDLNGATTSPGSYDHGYGFILTKRLKPFILHFDAIYAIPVSRRVDGVDTRYGNYIQWDFGVEYFLPKGFNLILEVNNVWQGDRRDDGEFIPATDMKVLNLSPGIGWSCEKIQTLFAYQRTLAGTNTDVNDSFIFTFVYTF